MIRDAGDGEKSTGEGQRDRGSGGRGGALK